MQIIQLCKCRIRNLTTKDPKYSIPSEIDFNECRAVLAESLS